MSDSKPKSSSSRETGILILRAGLGVVLLIHGILQLIKGQAHWATVALSSGVPGVHTSPVIFGCAAILCIIGGGLLLLMGLYFRLGCMLLAAVVAAALYSKVKIGVHYVELVNVAAALAVVTGLMFMGPGKHSLDER
jgi:putative oxidoreductase